MLTNFFGKSNPINFLIVSLIFMVGVVTWEFLHIKENIGLAYFIEKAITTILCIFMILLLDFIIRKNRLTEINTYAIFVFGSFLLLIPSLLNDMSLVLSNFFLLLAFRRILSIQSDKNLNKKILDASIWISVAMLFYFWSILYFIPLLISIFLKPNKNYRHFLIPVSGVIAVFILVTTYFAFGENDLYWFTSIPTSLSFDFSPYMNSHLLLLASAIALILILVGIHWLIRFPITQKKNRPNYIALMILLITGLSMVLLSNDKNGSEFFFLFAPASILLTNYIEMIRLNWLKEVLLWSLIGIPVLILFQ